MRVGGKAWIDGYWDAPWTLRQRLPNGFLVFSRADPRNGDAEYILIQGGDQEYYPDSNLSRPLIESLATMEKNARFARNKLSEIWLKDVE